VRRDARARRVLCRPQRDPKAELDCAPARVAAGEDTVGLEQELRTDAADGRAIGLCGQVVGHGNRAHAHVAKLRDRLPQGHDVILTVKARVGPDALRAGGRAHDVGIVGDNGHLERGGVVSSHDDVAQGDVARWGDRLV